MSSLVHPFPTIEPEGNMLRIANIIEEGKLGGPQVYMLLLENALKESVSSVIVMPEENSDVFQIRCRENGVTFKTFPLTRITKEIKPALRYLVCSWSEVIKLTKYFKEGNFDIVYVSGGSWQYKGVISGRLAEKKVLWHLNDTYMPWLFRQLFSLFSHFVDGYIYASERTKAYYSALHRTGKPEFVIPAPVDTVRFDPTCIYPGDEELISQWQDKTVIGTVANINPIKGLETFIQAIYQLNRERKEELIFVVIGPVFNRQKSYFSRLTSLCDNLGVDNIEFVGGRQDVRPLLARFDIYCCSSLAESSPISVWEAMSMAKPVVSTDVGDVPRYVHEGKNGYIVPIKDHHELGQKLALLYSDHQMRVKFGQISRAVAKDKLDVSICAERHLNAYSAISNC